MRERTVAFIVASLSVACVGTGGKTADRPAEPVLAIEAGRLRGATQDGVESFKGIPFAAPPIGNLRWREPQPAPQWQGVRDATRYGHDCMQVPFPSDAAPLGTEPAEVCLVLNVWKPADATGRLPEHSQKPSPARLPEHGQTPSPGRLLPVLVWIYGGGFVNGGSSPAVYSGARFANRGIVFVSFNYRLARFGFFAHPALTAAHEGKLGNYGIMDQIAALRWVHRNIARFGGDPNRVTLFGESAGGGSVQTLMTSPEARGLFQQAMVMSGGGRSLMRASMSLRKDSPASPSAETIGMNFARSVGIEGSGPDALAKLRALPAETIRGDLNMMALFRPGNGPQTFIAGPFVDGEVVTGPSDEKFIAEQQAKVPLMVGSNSADIGFSAAPTKDALFGQFGPDAAAARKVYDPTGTADFKALAAQVAMDQGMGEPARFLADRATAAGQPAWLYRFSYVADSMRKEWASGAPHATDIPYFFDTMDVKYGAALTSSDQAAARAANAYLSNYVVSGDPNGNGLPNWPRYDPQGRQLMDFTMDRGPVGGADPWRPRLDLVESLAARRK